MRVKSNGLDTTDTYETERIGSDNGDGPHPIVTTGRPIVGIYGNIWQNIDGLGLIERD